MLHLLGGLKSYRLKTRRHAVEVAHLEAWLDRSLAPLTNDYALCVELLRCRRLVKGYSDTHARGLAKFDSVMNAADMLKGREDASDWVARLREAALQDRRKGAFRRVRDCSELCLTQTARFVENNHPFVLHTGKGRRFSMARGSLGKGSHPESRLRGL